MSEKTFKVKLAVTPGMQMLGLMFSKPKNMLFEGWKSQITQIHSWFVFFEFDAVYLDENMKVLEKFHVKPFQVLENKIPAKFLLEISEPNDVIVGDVIVCKTE